MSAFGSDDSRSKRSREGQSEYPPFIDGSDYSELMEVLNTLADTCRTCMGKKVYFCLEEECQHNNPILCYRCQRHNHHLHRINQLYLAFVDRRGVPTRNQQAVNFLSELIEQFKSRRTKANRLMVESQIISAKLDDVIEVYEAMLNSLLKEDEIDRIYQVFQKALAQHRNQLNNELIYEPKQLEDIRHLWEGYKRQFQQISSITKFSNHNKLDKCLSSTTIGRDIQEYDKMLAELGAVPPPQKPNDMRRGKRIFQLHDKDDDAVDKGDWLALKESRRFDLFSKDLSSLFESTHLSKVVTPHWRHIPLQIGSLRTAELAGLPNLLTHRPGHIILESNHSRITDEIVKAIVHNTHLKSLSAKEWNNEKLPPNLVSLLLCVNDWKAVLPKSLKSLKLLLSERRVILRRRRSSLSEISEEGQPPSAALTNQIFQLPHLKSLTISKQTLAPEETLKFIRLAQKMQFRTMVLLSSNQASGIHKESCAIQEQYVPHYNDRLVHHHKTHRRSLLQALLAYRNPRLRHNYFTGAILEYAQLGEYGEALPEDNPFLNASVRSSASSVRSQPRANELPPPPPPAPFLFEDFIQPPRPLHFRVPSPTLID